MSVEFIYWYWIYPANYWRIYVSWRVSAPGPNCPGPTVHPEKVDSWAPGPNCPGPNYPGPNCPGPNCPGPNSPRTVDDDVHLIVLAASMR